ncbi:unnamed protein product [Ilex paraguariensis]|uniref:Uncharacterized protein n=1 Tax=Ilex paraguariensis TaxID=185542 RepID=A0ABC8S9G7_9AQUA
MNADLGTGYCRPRINPKPKTSQVHGVFYYKYLMIFFIISHQTHHHHTPYLSKLVPPMFTITLHISFFLYVLFSNTTAVTAVIGDTANAPPYIPSDYFFLDYGSSSSLNDADGRTWSGDARSKFSPSNISNTSSESTVSKQDLSVNQVPYMTARIFPSPFTYTFPISAYPKFIRLYFYPINYSNLDIANSFFAVTSDG